MIRCPQCGKRLNPTTPVCPAHGPPASAPAAPADAANPPPTAVATAPACPGYTVAGVLGVGGFGAVYRALRTSDQWPAAIKVALAENAPARAALLREARALRLVGPPWVPEVFDEGVLHDGSPYVAMELVAAPVLSSLLEETLGPWPLAHSAPVALALVQAVAALHAAGLVHRDLKPENVFLLPTGQVRVFDFGLCANAGDQADANAAGEGTPEYMAPEQDAAQATIDPRADVYSLGIMLYELLTGSPPFFGAPADAREGHRSRRPPLFARTLNVPGLVEDVVMRCLIKDRDRRFAHAGELALALQPALQTALAVREPTASGTGSIPPGPAAFGSTAGATTGAARAATAPAAPARRNERSLGLVFFAPREGRQVGASDLKRLGGDLANTAPGLGMVAAFGHEAGENPVRLAMQAAERLIEQGLALRALVDTSAVNVQARPNGARRYVSAVFARADRYPTATDPAGVLLTQAALDLLPHVDVVPVSDRPGRFKVIPQEQRDLTVAATAPLEIIGREADVRSLLDSARAAVAGPTPTIVTVVSDPGLGKSHLASALAGRLALAVPQASVLALRCQTGVEGSQSRTLREVVRWALDLPREKPPDEGRAFVADRFPDSGTKLWAALALTLGWVGTDISELRELADAPGALRAALARAAGEAVRWAAAKRPVALVVDDAHLADEVTLDALEYATLEEGHAAVWVCALARPALFAGRPTFGLRAASHKQITLEALEQDAAVALARLLLRPVEAVATSALIKLVGRTQGNPLLLVELVRGLKRDGAIKRSSKGDYHLATEEIDKLPDLPMVQWLATREIEALPADLSAHARVAALLGADVSEDELEGVLTFAEREGHPLETTLDASVGLRRLCDAGILVRHRSGRMSFRFGVLRDATYNMIAEDRRREVHDVAFRYYQSRLDLPDDERVPRVAYHAARAGWAHEAARLYLQQAERARDRHAYLEADALYTAAVSQIDPSDDRAQVIAAQGQGLMRFRLGHYEAALEKFTAALERARALAETERQLDTLFELATVCDYLYDFPRSKTLVEEAARLVPDVAQRPPLIHAKLLLAQGRSKYRFGEVDDAIALLMAAAKLAAEQGPQAYETHIQSLALAGATLATKGDLQLAETIFDEVLALCRQHGDRLHEAVVWLNRAFIWYPRGAFDRLREEYDHALRVARENGFTAIEAHVISNLAEINYMFGDLEAAERGALRNLEMSERMSGQSPYVTFLMVLLRARIKVTAGDLGGARELLAELTRRMEEARGAAPAPASIDLVPSDKVLFETVDLATGSWQEEAWRALLERSRRDSVQYEPIEVHALCGLTAGRTGHIPQARQALREALDLCQTIPNCLQPRVERWLADLPAG